MTQIRHLMSTNLLSYLLLKLKVGLIFFFVVVAMVVYISKLFYCLRTSYYMLCIIKASVIKVIALQQIYMFTYNLILLDYIKKDFYYRLHKIVSDINVYFRKKYCNCYCKPEKNVCITKRGLNMYDLDVGIQMKLDLRVCCCFNFKS